MSILKEIETVKNSPFTIKAFKKMPGHDKFYWHWTANIYEGSTKVGSAEDDGWGGPVSIHADQSIIDRLKNLYDDPSAIEADGSYITKLAFATETYNKMKRACTKKTLYVDHSSQKGEYFQVNVLFSSIVKKRILSENEKPESVVFINEIL